MTPLTSENASFLQGLCDFPDFHAQGNIKRSHSSLRIESEKGCQGEVEGSHFSVTDHLHLNILTGRGYPHRFGQIALALDKMGVKPNDQVSRFDPSFKGGASALHIAY